MPPDYFKAGELYASKSVVRAHYREFWKGIMIRDGQIGIIHEFHGLSRRVFYADEFDREAISLSYVGEGLKGDQQLTRGNRALHEAARTGSPVNVFFDCGDIQLPYGLSKRLEKHLLAGGEWRVLDAEYVRVTTEQRHVWRYRLEPLQERTRRVLQVHFLDSDQGFERLLREFAKVREDLYKEYDFILRARDSIAGHVGEYFAVKTFNVRYPQKPLVRVRSNFADLDAIQTGTGNRFAVKTVTEPRQKTSNIWTPLKDLPNSIDGFLVLDLDPFKLAPRGLFRLPISKAKRFWSTDKHQGAGKLTIDQAFRDTAEFVAT